jgi:ABC-type phosphate/phosphonate transport system permease subunit
MISFFARVPALTIALWAMCFAAPLAIIFLLIAAGRHARYRNEIAAFI